MALLSLVIAGLRPGHPRLGLDGERKKRMPGTSPGMTNPDDRLYLDAIVTG
jgi:hypothetical protein